MNRGYKIAAFALGMVIIFGIVLSIISAVSNADTDRRIEEIDRFLEEYENRQEPVITFESRMHMMAAAAKDAPEYTWNQEMIGKVVTFEVGHCCKSCQFYVASACVNRFYDWYDRDVIAMITDGNDEYYMMNPEYVYADEFNGANFWELYDEIMPTIDRATQAPADVYYWDCEDSQGEWATLIWNCPEDGCWFYR